MIGRDTGARARFLEFVRALAIEAGHPLPPAVTLSRDVHAPSVQVDLLVGSRTVRMIHDDRAGLEGLAFIEVVIGGIPRNAEPVIHAMLLVMNDAEWPGRYSIDEDSGSMTFAWPVAVEGVDTGAVAHWMALQLQKLEQWDFVCSDDVAVSGNRRLSFT
ncbi:hypothetical protein [Variovorax sp. KK3]|uniref:hypothetical protein n=1 Tax=Variovorax sp. KK3 TaxID=1855728 RepID=UPI00097CB6F4|nr:hypothetical protein [Variovorax sp. KK3]